MDKVSKAIAAGVGGAAGGGIAGAYVLPDGTPWYGYVIMAAVTALLPAIVTYLAPRNAD